MADFFKTLPAEDYTVYFHYNYYYCFIDCTIVTVDIFAWFLFFFVIANLFYNTFSIDQFSFFVACPN